MMHIEARDGYAWPIPSRTDALKVAGVVAAGIGIVAGAWWYLTRRGGASLAGARRRRRRRKR